VKYGKIKINKQTSTTAPGSFTTRYGIIVTTVLRKRIAFLTKRTQSRNRKFDVQ